MLKTQLLLADIYKIYYLVVNGNHLVKDFIDLLPEKDQKKISSLLRLAAKRGSLKNPEKSKKLHSDKQINIYEFKSKPYRILYTFFGEKTIILSHGFSKGAKIKNEIKRAQGFFNQLFEEKKK